MNIKKDNKLLYISLIIFTILFASVVIYIVYNTKKIVLYDEYEINEISEILNVNSKFYDGIISDESIDYDRISFNDIDDISINKQIASYVITNVISNTDYNKDKCIECYKYFSDNDDIRFYDVEDIDNIYDKMFNGSLKKINQDDVIGFNIIYYNEKIDKYYINISFTSHKPNVLSIFKNYSYNKDMLYIDYYYFKIEYNSDMKINEDENIESDNVKIYLYNLDNIMTNELSYSDLFNSDNVAIKYEDYVSYFDIVRYEFKYDSNNEKFVLNGIRRLEK